MRAITTAVFTVLGISVAFGQESWHVKTAVPSMPSTITKLPVLEQLAKESAGKTAEIARRVDPQYAIIRREEPAVAPPGPAVTPPPGRGYAPWTAREATPGKTPETVVIKYGPGGRMDMHYALYADYRLAKTKVEVRGPCYSACTLVLAYVEDICIAEGAFMAFHAVRSGETGVRLERETITAYWAMPEAVRGWIDDRGGFKNLPLNSFWYLSDRELWTMGYRKCP